MSAERLRPLRPDEWSEDVRELLGATTAPVAELEGESARDTPDTPDSESSGALNILRTMAHHPALLRPFLGFAAALALQGVLSRRDSELLALRTAWNCQSAFEWAHHAVYGRAAGLDDDEIQRVAAGPGHEGWSPEDRLMLRAADELHASQDLSGETWSGLRSRLSDAQLLEVAFVVGQYTMLSMVANATGVPVEAGLEPLPERNA